MAFADPFDTNVHSGGTGAVTPNIADQFIPEVWGQAILEAFQKKIMMKNVGIDLSPEIANQGDKIHLPHIGVPALSAFTQGGEIASDVTSGASMTSDETSLTVSEYNVGSAYIPDIVNVQSNYDLMEIYAKQLAYACARGYSEGTQATLGAEFGRTGNAGAILGMPVWIAQSPYMGSASGGESVTADASKGIKALEDLDDTDANNDDIVYGYAIHESALYYAFSKEAKMQASYRHSYLSTLVTCESVYGGAVRNADADGERRIFGLVDYEA